jgi:hypothetical protein
MEAMDEDAEEGGEDDDSDDDSDSEEDEEEGDEMAVDDEEEATVEPFDSAVGGLPTGLTAAMADAGLDSPTLFNLNAERVAHAAMPVGGTRITRSNSRGRGRGK